VEDNVPLIMRYACLFMLYSVFQKGYIYTKSRLKFNGINFSFNKMVNGLNFGKLGPLSVLLTDTTRGESTR
jgi:hypothetical protein